MNDNEEPTITTYRSCDGGTEVITRKIPKDILRFLTMEPRSFYRSGLYTMILETANQNDLHEDVVTKLLLDEFEIGAMGELQEQDFERALKFVVGLQPKPVMNFDEQHTVH